MHWSRRIEHASGCIQSIANGIAICGKLRSLRQRRQRGGIDSTGIRKDVRNIGSVNLLQIAVRILELYDALGERRKWNSARCARKLARIAPSLVAVKEKELILDDWSANGGTKRVSN